MVFFLSFACQPMNVSNERWTKACLHKQLQVTHPTCVADDLCVPYVEPHYLIQHQTGVHAGHYRHLVGSLGGGGWG